MNRYAADHATPGHVPPDLANLLVTGPFHNALHGAIAARGLTLDRLQSRLAEHGTPVSRATLSHWQSGRSQPEREVSMQALGNLERILGVPHHALLQLLEPPRPRGRRSGGDPLAFEEVFHNDSLVLEALGRFAPDWSRELVNVSFHDRVEVRADGAVHSAWCRRVMRATADGPDRIVVLYRSEAGAIPRLSALSGCVLGRSFSDAQLPGVVIAELLVGQPLRQGEHMILEYEVEFDGSPITDSRWEKRFDRPIREYVLEIVFDAARPPARCVQYRASDADADPDDVDERVVPLDSFARASTVAVDFGKGLLGMRWDWAPAAADKTEANTSP
jgi:hypothetical protein